MNSETLIDDLVVENGLCLKNASFHDISLSNELSVIYPPIVAMKPCVIIREMDKGFDDACDACDMKLRHKFLKCTFQK